MRAEEQLLQSIPARAPLLEVLDRICSAINSQIGNMVSLISLPGDDVTDHAAIARIAALFGLHAFCSSGVVAENDELLGSLEMYSCVQRRPSAREFQLIKRATCLAAIAIRHHNAANHHSYGCILGNRPVRGRVLEWPLSMN
jgi:GAF domain-containing protein